MKKGTFASLDSYRESERRRALLRAAALTRRENDVLRELIAHGGQTNKAIALRLSLTEGTVKVYFSRLLVKLAVSNRVALALYAERRWQNQS